MKTRNILLIVEGEVSEVEFFNKMGELFFDKRTKIIFYSFKSNIYSLYNKIKEYDDYTSTISILKDITKNKDELSKLNVKFSEIYLIFDFDPQEPAYSDDIICKMTDTFSNETEFGKLFINYPMLEAFRDHKNFDVKDYLETQISINGLTSEKYRFHIASNGYTKRINHFTSKHFKKFCKMSILKSQFIVNKAKKYPSLDVFFADLTQSRILSSQIILKNNTQKIYVVNTCVQFLVYYFGIKYYDDIMKS